MAMQRNRLLFLGITAAVATWILVDGIQNYLNESIKYLDKSYPTTTSASSSSTGLQSASSPNSLDSKLTYMEEKTLFGERK